MENKKDTGLGDSIKRITNYFGIKQCEKCKERQTFFNTLIPYKNNKLIMTDKQKEIFEMYLNARPITKVACNTLNRMRKEELDGAWTDSCFCTLSQRTAFINELKRWYNSL